MKQKRIFSLLVTLLLIGCVSVTVLGAEVPDVTRKCSATFTMRYGEATVAGGSLTLYQVVEVAAQSGGYSFVPAGDFAACGESFEQFDDTDLANRLVAFARQQNLQGQMTQEVDVTGKITFENLAVGVYLVEQNQPAPGYESIAPFVIALPYVEDGVYHYDLVAEPKTQLKPEASSTPESQPEPNLPQTGQLWWPVPLLLCGGLALLIVGFLMKGRKQANENA